MIGEKKVSVVKERIINNIVELITRIGKTDFNIKNPDGGYIMTMDPITTISPVGYDVSITINKSNPPNKECLFFWLSGASVGYLLFIVEELKFLIEYDNAVTKIKNKKHKWNNKKRIWEHEFIDETTLSNNVRYKMRKSGLKRYIAKKSKDI